MHSSEKQVDVEILTAACRPRLGGMTAWIEQIARGLVKLGWRVRLVGILDHPDSMSDQPFEFVHLPLSAPGVLPHPLLDRAWRWYNFRRSFRTPPQPLPRIRISDCTPGILNLVHRWSASDGVPHCVLCGGNVFLETETVPFSKWFHRRIRRDLCSANKIFVDGPDLVRVFQERGIPSESIRIQYHGVDENWLSVEKQMPSGLLDRPFRPVWHGRLSTTGGPLRFLDIIRRINDIDVRLIGDGPDKEAVQACLQEIQHDDWYLGPLSEGELIQELVQSDCGLYPLQNMAGVPRVLLDAMAVGLPVIAWQTGAVSELIQSGFNGFLVDGVEESIKILDKLKEQPEYAHQIGTAARQTIQDHWQASRMVAQLARELEECFNR